MPNALSLPRGRDTFPLCTVGGRLHTPARLQQGRGQTTSALGPASLTLASSSSLDCPCCPLTSAPTAHATATHSLFLFPSAACPGCASLPASMHGSCRPWNPPPRSYMVQTCPSSITVWSRFHIHLILTATLHLHQLLPPHTSFCKPNDYRSNVAPKYIFFGCTMLSENWVTYVKLLEFIYTLRFQVSLEKSGVLDFPGGPVLKNPSANAGDPGSIPSLGRFHMLQGH